MCIIFNANFHVLIQFTCGDIHTYLLYGYQKHICPTDDDLSPTLTTQAPVKCLDGYFPFHL